MERLLLAVLLLMASPIVAMMSNDVKKTALTEARNTHQNNEKTKQRCVHDFLKSFPRVLPYYFSLNNVAMVGHTTRIYCPGINHKIIVPCKETFAIILPISTWSAIVRNPKLVKSLACGFFEEKPIVYNSFVFVTTSERGNSTIFFQDLQKNQDFDVTIINCP